MMVPFVEEDRSGRVLVEMVHVITEFPRRDLSNILPFRLLAGVPNRRFAGSIEWL